MHRFSLLLLTLMLVAPLRAQTRPATAPVTAPASAPARRALIMPPGFIKITVGHRTALIEPADEQWVRSALTTLTPATLPSTMPADVQSRLQSQRQALKQRIATDLALTDAAAIDTRLIETLGKALKELEEANPPLFYMATTDLRINELVKGGWSDPRFHYNRAADTVQVVPAQPSTVVADDDLIVPIIYGSTTSQADRVKVLTDSVRATELTVANILARQGLVTTYLALVNILIEESIKPLKLKPDQEWFGIGLAGVLACRYNATLTGRTVDELIRGMTADTQNNPIRSRAINLLHPNQPAEMRPEAIAPYVDAFRSRSTRVMNNLLTRAGDDAAPKILSEIRKNPPTDGPALVKQIQQVTGIDLTPELLPGS